MHDNEPIIDIDKSTHLPYNHRMDNKTTSNLAPSRAAVQWPHPTSPQNKATRTAALEGLAE